MQDAGYTHLRESFNLKVPPLALELKQGTEPDEKTIDYGFGRVKILSKRVKVGTTNCEHIATAIKYQGINLAYLSQIFKEIDVPELTRFILQQPTSEIRRCIWYLYEWLTEDTLDIPDITPVKYVKLLREQYYYTSVTCIRDKRTAVDNNLIGNKEFCPVIRKTSAIKEWATKDMMELAREELRALGNFVDIDIINRSVNYLYTKETKSSTEIENEDSDERKTAKFYRALKACGLYPLSKNRLINVQNQIVQPTAKDTDYRDCNNYVGHKNRRSGAEFVHYVCPLFQHVESMMGGLLKMHESLLVDNTLPAMMHAAIVSFGLVYIHPFNDGNGRTHRYLIHDILKARSKNKDDLIIPVSASILQDMKSYDQVLEIISKPVIDSCDYDLNHKDEILIHNDIHHFYRYPDLTCHVDFLYKMMSASIKKDLLPEIVQIYMYDSVREIINNNYDLPNKELNVLVNVLMENDGAIGKKKKKRGMFGDYLSEEEISQIEEISIELIASMKDTFQSVLKLPDS